MAEELVEIKEPVVKHKLAFKHLPAYAEYLLNNKLEAYVRYAIKISVELDIPILRYFKHLSDVEMVEMSKTANAAFFKLIMQNNLDEYVQETIKRWVQNQLPTITRDQIIAEDITMGTYVRKQSFIHFLPSYAPNTADAIELISEIDRFHLATESASFRAFLEIQQEKLNDLNNSLKAHEEQLLEAQEIAKLGSFEWDLTGEGKTTYTPQMLEIFEMEETSDLNDFLNYVHPSDREKVQAAIDKALKGDGAYECEYRYERSGREKVIWSRGIVVFKEGKPLFMKGTVMDMTERHYMARRLQRNEELYKQAQSLTHIGNWTWDVRTNLITWSDEFYRIFGLEPQSEKITLERFNSFIHPDDKDKISHLLHEAIETGKGHSVYYKIISADDKLKIIHRNTEVLADTNGKVYKIIGTGQDVTQEFLLNKELKEREEYIYKLIHNAPDAIIVIDQQGKTVLWNPKTKEIFGWGEEETLGKNIIEVGMMPQYGRQHIAMLSSMEEKVLNKTFEVKATTKTGKEIFVSLIISKSVQAGAPVYIAFVRDISNEKKLKTELENKKEQLINLNVNLARKNTALVRSNNELSSFTYIASHDLQEPLRKIKTFSNRVLENEYSALSDRGKEFFDKIITSSSHMQKLINDLLAYSHTDTKEKNLEPVDLNKVLEEIKNAYKDLIEEKQLVIESTGLPVINGIAFQLQQLIENLIGNSIKYSKPKVPTHIKIKSVVESSFRQGAHYKITIEDNGIGFEPKYAEKIFEVFQRLHPKNQYSGTGIGLAICKKIIENHGGLISADSKVNEGATFTIYLPKK